MPFLGAQGSGTVQGLCIRMCSWKLGDLTPLGWPPLRTLMSPWRGGGGSVLLPVSWERWTDFNQGTYIPLLSSHAHRKGHRLQCDQHGLSRGMGGGSHPAPHFPAHPDFCADPHCAPGEPERKPDTVWPRAWCFVPGGDRGQSMWKREFQSPPESEDR